MAMLSRKRHLPIEKGSVILPFSQSQTLSKMFRRVGKPLMMAFPWNFFHIP